MSGLGKCVSVALLISVFAASNVCAQATAQISGTARDQSGAVLPGVELHVTQTEMGLTRDAVTNESGSYVFTNLPLGPYRLEAVLPGFRTYVQTGIVLQVNSNPSVNVTLDVGQVAETVEVQANAALVETRNAGVGQVIENARILDLPLNGRAVVELVALAGAATPAPTVTGANRDPFTRGNLSVAGGLNTGLNYTLDGANHNNQFDNGYLSMPFPDALQEFKVETSATSAQSGVKSSGSVSLVTKSGTNDFHGNLFEFVRNGKFNARNAFATKRDTIKRNQFGGTLGGPLARNKLFFFGGYQGTTLRQDPSNSISFVPTAAMIAGDFTAFASPACNGGRQITLRGPFSNNRVDPALFSKPAMAYASKLPGTADPCGRIVYSPISLENDHQVIGRIDYQRNATHTIFGRYLAENVFDPTPYSLSKNLLTANVNGIEGLVQAFTIGDTHLYGARIVNAIHLTANRFASNKTTPDLSSLHVGPADIGIKMFSYQPNNASDINVTGAFNVSRTSGPVKLATFSAGDDVSVLRGSHQLAFGGQAAEWWYNLYGEVYNHGTFTFNGQTTGLGMADFLLGNAFQLRMGTNTAHNKRISYASLYATDTWKLNQKLTLTYGLRWEPFFPQVNIDGSTTHFDRDAMKNGIRSTRFKNTPPGMFFNGDPQYKTGLQVMSNKWWNFSPRVGFAWDPQGNGRTSVRVSAGTFYDYPQAQYQNGLSNSPPWNPLIYRNDVKLEDPWANEPGGDPFPIPYGKDAASDAPWPLYALASALDYDTPNMQVAQWNLSLQKQIRVDWLLSGTYLGNHTTHMWTVQALNPAVFLPGGPCTLNGVAYNPCSSTANTDQRRRFSLENGQVGRYYGFVDRIDSGGTASYNGLLLSVERRAMRGLTVIGNYTWSHCIGDPWQENDTNIGSGGWSNPDNRHFDRGNCTNGATDRRHLLNFSAVAETPRFSRPALRAVGSGWHLSPILKILSGDYLSITTNQDRALTGINSQRVNQVLANPYGDGSPSRFLNPAAFALPPLGTLGTIGKGSIAGPSMWQFDVAVSRIFQVREGQRMEFRAEAFNVTNSFIMNDPATILNLNTFGQVTTARDPRIMQFALKYSF